MKYTGWCQNDFNVQAYRRHLWRGAGAGWERGGEGDLGLVCELLGDKRRRQLQ
jgi:hypothetical protein